MSSTATLPEVATWSFDLSHSSISFVARHLVVSKVRGGFDSFSGTVTVADPIEQSSVEVLIDAASISTGDAQRDGHLVSDDFLAAEAYPTLSFRSTGLRHEGGDDWVLAGELTIKDVTRPVELQVSYLGALTDPWGNQKVAFTAATEIDREEWGITWNQALETGGVLVGKRVTIEIEAQLAKA